MDFIEKIEAIETNIRYDIKTSQIIEIMNHVSVRSHGDEVYSAIRLAFRHGYAQGGKATKAKRKEISDDAQRIVNSLGDLDSKQLKQVRTIVERLTGKKKNMSNIDLEVKKYHEDICRELEQVTGIQPLNSIYWFTRTKREIQERNYEAARSALDEEENADE